MKQSSGEMRRENDHLCLLLKTVSCPGRHQRVYARLRRAMAALLQRCAAEPGPMHQRARGFLCPGSAQQCYALQRVRDTEEQAHRYRVSSVLNWP
jgi:hypothetical protein